MSKYIEYYNAPWCGPCRAVTPLIKAVAEKRKFPLREYNVDTSGAKAMERGIRAIPQLLLIDTGDDDEGDTVVARIIGIRKKKEYMREIK